MGREQKREAYLNFLRAKMVSAPLMGIEIDPSEVNRILKPHQRDIVLWAIRGGRRAIFAAFGLGKGFMQLEIARLMVKHCGGQFLIIAPLGVRQEFMRDAAKLGIAITFVRTDAECSGDGVYITNYESVREGKLDPRRFIGASLDEAACFAPGTLVDTPTGKRPIESIKSGDEIWNAYGLDIVSQIHKSEVTCAVKILVDGKAILCSPDHILFTTRGWISASELQPGDSLVETGAAVRLLWSGDHPEILPGGQKTLLQSLLLREMEELPGGDHRAYARHETLPAPAAPKPQCEMAATPPMRVVREDVPVEVQLRTEAPLLRERVLSQVANEPARTQTDHGYLLPYGGSAEQAREESRCVLGSGYARDPGAEAIPGGAGAKFIRGYVEQDPEHDAAARHSTKVDRWQGPRTNRTAAHPPNSPGPEMGSRVSGASQPAPSESSDVLLPRLGTSAAQDSHRGRWRNASHEGVEDPGCKERRASPFAWVDGVEILERGHPELERFRKEDGSVYFYDLTATRHPSYSVNGLLVHNCLRGFGGTKTFREFMRVFEGSGIRYRFVATATPSPNEYIELLAYSAFLEVMQVGEAKTRFFKRNSEKADQLTIHEHKKREFWLWCATWAIFLQRPSDLGYSDEGYDLPEMEVHWHEIASDHSDAGHEVSGQGRLVKSAAIGVTHAAREKRDSLPGRIAKMMELRALDPAAHRIIWHDLEAEREAIEKATGAAAVWGSQDLDEREKIVADFSDGRIPELAGKPVMLGSGCNLQRHCAWAIYLGIGFKFNDFYQSIHRIHRFLQDKRVRIDLIYTEAEREIRRTLEDKWIRHVEMMKEMSEIIREFGLAEAALASTLQRSIGVERRDAAGASWTLVNNDSVLECIDAPDESVHLILTSIPFSTQYEYTPSYNDFGHTDDNEHFWRQMDFLTPELFRMLKPGRIAAIHVKDRIVPGGINKLGFQTVAPFHAEAINHFTKHGFAYMGMKTIVTDVVRENNQTYRLGWTEQCKDGTKMGVGMPEYLLIFRRPPSDTSNSYADEPVIKDKGKYTRSRWQVDAHGFARSSGQRLIAPEDMDRLTHQQIFQLFRKHTTENVYNYENHVALAESLECCPGCGHIHLGVTDDNAKRCGNGGCRCAKPSGRLPVTFMLLQPSSWSDDVWSDVTRMLGMNTLQHQAGREQHLCPMQWDIADRAITQYTMAGEMVFDPFAGLGTVPYRAVLLGRRGLGVELNTRYWADGCVYCEAAEQKMSTPTLFDMFKVEATT